MNNYNKKAIQDVYKNAHIALQSISDLLPNVDDTKLKEELKTQSKGYKDIINEITSFMKQNKLEPQDINVFKKAMMWTSIKMKTMINNSKNQVAEMMIKGSVMGINELSAMKNEGKNLNDGILQLVEKLLSFEESSSENLKKFL